MNFDRGSFDACDATPRQLFDSGRYAECLHATMQVYNITNDPARTQAAIEDTGVLHELAHLACGICTWTHRDLSELRELIPEPSNAITEYYSDRNDSGYAALTASA